MDSGAPSASAVMDWTTVSLREFEFLQTTGRRFFSALNVPPFLMQYIKQEPVDTVEFVCVDISTPANTLP
jgi:hypothetical protein